jgi:branched-chain amino acid transport system permease protein
MDLFFRTVVEGMLQGGVYALVVLGVIVVAKATKVINLAYGGILLFLTYLLWWLVDTANIPLPLALLIMVGAAVLVGLGVERLLMRPLMGRPEMGLITFVMTLVLGFSIMQGLSILAFGGVPHVMPKIFPEGNLSFGGLAFSYTTFFSFLISMAMFLVFVLYFRYSRNGLAMRCVSEDTIASQSLGISVKRICSYAWVVGALSAAVGGILLSSMYALDTGIGGFAMMRALPVLLLAGLDSLPGGFVGALLVGLAESFSGTYIDRHVAGFSELLPFILMLVVLLILPSGLFGKKLIRRI